MQWQQKFQSDPESRIPAGSPPKFNHLYLCHARHNLKISERSVHNFLSYLANTHTQTDRQTVWQKHYLLSGGN